MTAFSAYGLNVFELLSGMTAGEYKRFKGLKKQNLRDNMTDMVLCFWFLVSGFWFPSSTSTRNFD